MCRRIFLNNSVRSNSSFAKSSSDTYPFSSWLLLSIFLSSTLSNPAMNFFASVTFCKYVSTMSSVCSCTYLSHALRVRFCGSDKDISLHACSTSSSTSISYVPYVDAFVAKSDNDLYNWPREKSARGNTKRQERERGARIFSHQHSCLTEIDTET